MRNERDRAIVYDWVRLLATLMVVIGHSTYLSISNGNGGVNYQLPLDTSIVYMNIVEIIGILGGWIYGFHMPLFFALSGAVLAIKPIPSIDDFIKSKIKKLLVPYVICGCVFMLPIKYMGDFFDINSIVSAYQMFWSGATSGHLWFLPALFWCMIIFVIVYKCKKRCKIESLYILLFIFGGIQIIVQNVQGDIFLLKTGLKYIFWFALGYVFEIEGRKYIELWSGKKVCILFGLFTIFAMMLWKRIVIFSGPCIIVCGCVWTYLLAELCSRKLIKITRTRFWKLIMRNMFNIYLFHDPLNYIILKYAFRSDMLSNPVTSILYFILRTLGVVVVSIFIGEIINNISSRKKRIRC